ncbi:MULTISPECIES: class I SAM-dependent methyltransferase [Streptomyces]|uniref:Class I SAM-dependent methyltransferase n=1 Tax=Streptomyces tsukubensis (strain DSM 42081 / NBRC 108919 / NRRL 18488 / 9993) TaxID=1114943 RepID=A0A7G3UDG3_STRT9|nr:MULTISPECIES: class I SAM-dependent methyltransferase [Streptomyces]AZK95515.1 SAM-dependent methyltransferase [Streptomyces tsukubensis]MYS66694.1 methyltransferase domain-containing protein [Streptomyces sp. SID5473]QKM68443.1 class I SAM-dependent methyltransferase [Streptomyces tsukubensis NRRL18488]TAI43260.1 class I SAM-dependent methyltransferase [Streptomyces tsukubensis]
MYLREIPEGWRETNKSNWDERVPIHMTGDFYEIDAFLAGKDPLRDFEVAEVGDVSGRSLLHLQCHIGLDTLGWARHGASRVVGLDFSEPAVESARALAAKIGLGPERAAFVAADVYDAAAAVPEGPYDIVYTGVGALSWLPDIKRWAETAASFVAPGGFLYLAEFHPITDVLDDETGSRIVHDYFAREPWQEDEPGTYADRSAETVHNRTVEWQHPIGEVVSALCATGLRLEFLHEHDVSLFERFDSLEKRDGYLRFPAGQPRVPLMYSLKASRPAAS